MTVVRRADPSGNYMAVRENPEMKEPSVAMRASVKDGGCSWRMCLRRMVAYVDRRAFATAVLRKVKEREGEHAGKAAVGRTPWLLHLGLSLA